MTRTHGFAADGQPPPNLARRQAYRGSRTATQAGFDAEIEGQLQEANAARPTRRRRTLVVSGRSAADGPGHCVLLSGGKAEAVSASRRPSLLPGERLRHGTMPPAEPLRELVGPAGHPDGWESRIFILAHPFAGRDQRHVKLPTDRTQPVLNPSATPWRTSCGTPGPRASAQTDGYPFWRQESQQVAQGPHCGPPRRKSVRRQRRRFAPTGVSAARCVGGGAVQYPIPRTRPLPRFIQSIGCGTETASRLSKLTRCVVAGRGPGAKQRAQADALSRQSARSVADPCQLR